MRHKGVLQREGKTRVYRRSLRGEGMVWQHTRPDPNGG